MTPKRKVTKHIVNGDTEKTQLGIMVMDAPGAGGANHAYDIHDYYGYDLCRINFQKGPIKEQGVNGITQEALLAICADRLESFQAGSFACEDNAEALLHIQKALNCLKKRTTDRIARNVEGENKL